ncbi:MAG: hypothetical protein LUD69_04375 [Oscillospiraceae bacterium]|nr:hypothetical protein [Oscillospiraceae bacterium]
MEKTAYTKAMGVLESEKRLQEEAKYILMAKELGIRQETLNKMISMFSIHKAYRDALKKVVGEDGE